jgi:outer membrane protein assembly factor BamA
MMKKYILSLLVFLFLNNNLYANENVINLINIDGIQRIDKETVISYANVSKGDVYTEEIVN